MQVHITVNTPTRVRLSGQVPEGFEKVTRNLIKGSGRSAYLCYRRRTERDDGIPPLADVVIVYGEEEPGKA